MSLENMDIYSFAIKGIAIIISLTIHEYAHALVSHVQGDKTPEYYGRLTTNPLAHLDLMGIVALFLFSFGWAKPVPINSSNYKNERLGVILTSIAGPLSNVLLAFFAVLIFHGLQPENEGIIRFINELFRINLGLAVFNMLPFPPLDGSKIIAELLGRKVADLIYRINRFGIAILFMLLWLKPVNEFLGYIIRQLAVFLEGIAMAIV